MSLFPEKKLSEKCPVCFGEINIETGNCIVCVARDIHKGRKTKNSLKRKNTNKVINKRLDIVKDIWQEYDHPYLYEPGRLEKHNLSCGCRMCKYEKKNGITKAKYKLQDDVWQEIFDYNEYKEDLYEQ